MRSRVGPGDAAVTPLAGREICGSGPEWACWLEASGVGQVNATTSRRRVVFLYLRPPEGTDGAGRAHHRPGAREDQPHHQPRLRHAPLCLAQQARRFGVGPQQAARAAAASPEEAPQPPTSTLRMRLHAAAILKPETALGFWRFPGGKVAPAMVWLR